MRETELIPGTVGEILVATADTGYLSLAHRYSLMMAILDESLNEEETQAVDRLLRFVVRGRIRW
jgi:hypothetical protein